MLARISVNGQIVIPVGLRREYGLEPGMVVRIVDTGQGILLNPVTEKTISAARGMFRGSGILQFMLELRRWG